MRSAPIILPVILILAAAPGRALSQEPPQEKPAHEERQFDRETVARHFKDHCQPCHAVPDPDQELDRAWLDQIHRTA